MIYHLKQTFSYPLFWYFSHCVPKTSTVLIFFFTRTGLKHTLTHTHTHTNTHTHIYMNACTPSHNCKYIRLKLFSADNKERTGNGPVTSYSSILQVERQMMHSETAERVAHQSPLTLAFRQSLLSEDDFHLLEFGRETCEPRTAKIPCRKRRSPLERI